MKKYHIGQDILIGVWGVLAVLLVFLTVMSLIPPHTAVEIREEIRVSSSRLNAAKDEEGIYLVEFSGALRNKTGETLTVEKLTVPAVASKKEDVVFCIEKVVIPPRSTVTVSASKEANGDYGKVGEITASVNGEELCLRNPAQTNLTASFLLAALAAFAVFFTVRESKIRYYMYQEDRYDRMHEAD